MNKLTKDEQKTLEWLCLVGNLKIKELEKTADSEKMVLIQQHKTNIMIKIGTNKESNKNCFLFHFIVDELKFLLYYITIKEI